MAHLTTTQPYGQYYASNSKEHMSLRNAAINNFKPDQVFALKSEKSTDFVNQISDLGKKFCYRGMTSRVPTECDIDVNNPNIITFRERKDIINTYGAIDEDVVIKNAGMLWGQRDWTVQADKEIVTPTTARGELTNAGLALTADGKKLMLNRFQSEVLGEQIFASLTPEGRKALRVEKNKYEWFNPTSGELVNDGLTVLHITLQKLRPNKLILAFDEIKKMKLITPDKFAHNISEWDSAFEQARIEIELKIPNEYSEMAYINDYFIACLTTPVKSFCQEVSSLKTKWQLGTPMSVDFVRTQITQMYVNFEADDTWKQELAEVSQIIALTTQVQQLSTKLETTIALATTDHQSGKAGSDRKRTTNNKKYTVAPWRLVKKGDTIKCDKGHTWHWCTEEHYSDGAAHKGMYATHPPGKHAEWRADIDRKRATPGGAASTNSSDPSQTAVNDDTKKKLALSEKLRTALTTQAGLSQEAFTRIWDESCKDSGNA